MKPSPSPCFSPDAANVGVQFCAIRWTKSKDQNSRLWISVRVCFRPKSLASAGRPSTVPTDPTPYSASGRRLFCDWGRRVGTECRLCGSIADDGNPRRSANRKAQAFLSSVHEKLVERDRLLNEWEEHCREGVGGGADGRAPALNPITSIPRKPSIARACEVHREHPDYPVSEARIFRFRKFAKVRRKAERC